MAPGNEVHVDDESFPALPNDILVDDKYLRALPRTYEECSW